MFFGCLIKARIRSCVAFFKFFSRINAAFLIPFLQYIQESMESYEMCIGTLCCCADSVLIMVVLRVPCSICHLLDFG